MCICLYVYYLYICICVLMAHVERECACVCVMYALYLCVHLCHLFLPLTWVSNSLVFGQPGQTRDWNWTSQARELCSCTCRCVCVCVCVWHVSRVCMCVFVCVECVLIFFACYLFQSSACGSIVQVSTSWTS